MADSSVPAGVDPSELYDGPRVVPLASGKATLLAPEDLVKPIPPAHPTPPPPPPASEVSQDTKQQTEYALVIGLALDVLSARLLGLVALVTGCFLWGCVVIYPEEMRIIAAACFSVTLFGPAMWVCWKHGQNR